MRRVPWPPPSWAAFSSARPSACCHFRLFRQNRSIVGGYYIPVWLQFPRGWAIGASRMARRIVPCTEGIAINCIMLHVLSTPLHGCCFFDQQLDGIERHLSASEAMPVGRGVTRHDDRRVELAVRDFANERSVDITSSVSSSNSLLKPNLAHGVDKRHGKIASGANEQVLSGWAFGRECAKSPQNWREFGFRP